MSNGNWIREFIQVATDCAILEVPVKRLGPFAVHFGIGSHRARISITHVRTGMPLAAPEPATLPNGSRKR